MALIVEDGTGIPNSNSYVSESDISAFLTARGLLSSNLDADAKIEAMALRAMDNLNVLDYCGYRSNESQSLPFPRSGIELSDCRELASDTIPQELKDAQCWLVYYIDSGSDPSSAQSQLIKFEKVDVLEVEYQDGGAFNSTSINSLPTVKNLLKYLVCQSDYLDRA